MRNLTFIGFDVPGYGDQYKDYSSQASLLDSDIVIFSPRFYYETSYQRYQGKTQYTESSSQKVQQHTDHWKREIQYFLEAGKNIFIFLTDYQEFVVYTGLQDFSGTGKNKTTINYVTDYNNYNFLPISNVKVIPATGDRIKFINNYSFREFYEEFKDLLSYKVYLDIEDTNVLFKTYTGNKILGCYKKILNGNLIFLPFLNFEDDKFIVEKDDDILWTDDALNLGQKLVNCIIKIDKELLLSSGKTPPPDWLNSDRYRLIKEIEIRKQINKKNTQILKLNEELSSLVDQLEKENELKALLYESGKPLENAVISALKILGYSAENYNDGTLELDQVILSPEGQRFIGECEGKDNRAIDITKLRQLSDAINEDFERDEVEEEAFGLLFGNPFRLMKIEERDDPFTLKCLQAAKRLNIGLIVTSELFDVCKYLKDTNDEKFKIECRETIHTGLGGIIKFPSIPKKSLAN